MIVDEVKKKDADGVVFCMMKFCDPEEYDYPVVKSDIEASNIPTLYIEIDQQTSNNEQVSKYYFTSSALFNWLFV